MQHAMQAAISRPQKAEPVYYACHMCPVLLGVYANYSNANADTGRKAE